MKELIEGEELGKSDKKREQSQGEGGREEAGDSQNNTLN